MMEIWPWPALLVMAYGSFCFTVGILVGMSFLKRGGNNE
jgi:hypothetical protein